MDGGQICSEPRLKMASTWLNHGSALPCAANDMTDEAQVLFPQLWKNGHFTLSGRQGLCRAPIRGDLGARRA